METPTLTCQTESRRDLVRHSPLFGLDYLEVSDDQLTLTVYFLGRAPKEISPANLQITGGERITGIKVTGVLVQRPEDKTLDDSMEVTVDQAGDFSVYQLCICALDQRGHATGAPLDGFDQRYACVEFSFKAGCPSDLDCHAPMVCPPPKRTEPEINYLAKDYESFRQLILDRLAVTMPDWRERHIPDLGITLVEVLAYVGDYLSYYQDAVATEAYLATARQRISVRRHARLVDYFMHEGCNARAWLCLSLKSQESFELKPAEVWFLSGLDQSPALAGKTILSAADLKAGTGIAYEAFEPLVADRQKSITLYSAHNTISFYTWQDRQCCLPTGATKAVLVDTWSEKFPTDSGKTGRQGKRPIDAGDVLVFEEVIGPTTGNPADADPSRRWAVRLTRVTPLTDPLNKTGADKKPVRLLEIEWTAADALPFPLCLSARLPAPDCRIIGDISVARGNVILVDHGRTVHPCEDLGVVEKISETGNCACEGSILEMTAVPGVFRPKLKQTPLTFHEPLRAGQPAAKMLDQDPRKAAPAIVLKSIAPAPDGTEPLFVPADLQDAKAIASTLKARTTPKARLLFNRLALKTKKAVDHWDGTSTAPEEMLAALIADLTALLESWRPQRDLLESESSDAQFVVETDNDGAAYLRFGDGQCGRQPGAGTGFMACYRTGNGPAGNIGADRITKIVFQNQTVGGLVLTLRNPLPARGGTAPEPVAEVKLFAPGAFKQVLERAVTAADYAAMAERNPRLQQAHAALRWTGSWYEALVAVDPRGNENPDDILLRQVAGQLHRFRRVGHDLAVSAAAYVALQLEISICVLPNYLRGHVEAALRDVFSNRVLPDGRLGFFHPDNLTFGEGIYLSRIIAAAQSVAGVQSVEVTTFQRRAEPANGELGTGVLALGPMEIARLDNDRNFPEHGTLTLNLRGGR